MAQTECRITIYRQLENNHKILKVRHITTKILIVDLTDKKILTLNGYCGVGSSTDTTIINILLRIFKIKGYATRNKGYYRIEKEGKVLIDVKSSKPIPEFYDTSLYEKINAWNLPYFKKNYQHLL